MSAALAEDLSQFALHLPVVVVPPPPTGTCLSAPPPHHVVHGVGEAACRDGGGPSVAVDLTSVAAAQSMPKCPEVEAWAKDGSSYAGNLLTDVIVYRSLRARQMGGETLHGDDAGSLSQLDSRLRPGERNARADGRASRRFLRWDTNAIAGVALVRPNDPDAPHLPVDTVDLGAGGVCVVTELTLAPGDEIAVAVRGDGDDAARHIVQPARVAWSRGRRVGLMFAGGPRWGN